VRSMFEKVVPSPDVSAITIYPKSFVRSWDLGVRDADVVDIWLLDGGKYLLSFGNGIVTCWDM
jgi:hypothetical protein